MTWHISRRPNCREHAKAGSLLYLELLSANSLAVGGIDAIELAHQGLELQANQIQS